MKSKRNIIIVLVLSLISIITIGISYAFWQVTKTQIEENVITTGCVDVKIENELNQINLGEAYPIEDSDGLELKPFTFTVTNKCNVYTDYEIGLEMLSNTNLESKYVKVLINQVGIKKSPKLLSNYENESKTIIDGAKEGRILLKGKLDPTTDDNKPSKKDYELRLWLDNDSPKSIMNQTFTSKIVINGSQGSEPKPSYEICNQNEESASCTIAKLADEDTTNLIYDDTDDKNLRYIGKEVNNYIDIGDRDSDNKPILWQIIGIMNNVLVVDDENNEHQESLVKIIRAEDIGILSWDTSANEVNDGRGVNEWSEADIMSNLNNGAYWNKKSGQCYNGYNDAKVTCDFSSTGLTPTVKENIAKVRWNTGTFESYDTSEWLANATYKAERSENIGKICNGGNDCNDKVERHTTWDGYIGLMYPSDYMYAVGGDVRNNCLTTSMANWNNSNPNCKGNDWLYISEKILWTMTPVPNSSYAYYVFFVMPEGHVLSGSALAARGIRPTAYLKENLKIADNPNPDKTYGSKENPFQLKNN